MIEQLRQTYISTNLSSGRYQDIKAGGEALIQKETWVSYRHKLICLSRLSKSHIETDITLGLYGALCMWRHNDSVKQLTADATSFY